MGLLAGLVLNDLTNKLISCCKVSLVCLVIRGCAGFGEWERR